MLGVFFFVDVGIFVLVAGHESDETYHVAEHTSDGGIHNSFSHPIFFARLQEVLNTGPGPARLG